MKAKPENQSVIALVAFLEQQSRKNKAPIWKDVSELVSKAGRKKAGVNLYKLDKYSKEGDTLVVPTKVLGIGSLSHKITLAALSISKPARSAVEKSGSKVLSIRAFATANPKGSKARIII
ncbi:MAG: 50S ribosomal protein L18e [Candidatus Micrarchaeia archaeon]|jgi:large subunit ribosomal protein L18e